MKKLKKRLPAKKRTPLIAVQPNSSQSRENVQNGKVMKKGLKSQLACCTAKLGTDHVWTAGDVFADKVWKSSVSSGTENADMAAPANRGRRLTRREKLDEWRKSRRLTRQKKKSGEERQKVSSRRARQLNRFSSVSRKTVVADRENLRPSTLQLRHKKNVSKTRKENTKKCKSQKKVQLASVKAKSDSENTRTRQNTNAETGKRKGLSKVRIKESKNSSVSLQKTTENHRKGVNRHGRFSMYVSSTRRKSLSRPPFLPPSRRATYSYCSISKSKISSSSTDKRRGRKTTKADKLRSRSVERHSKKIPFSTSVRAQRRSMSVERQIANRRKKLQKRRLNNENASTSSEGTPSPSIVETVIKDEINVPSKSCKYNFDEQENICKKEIASKYFLDEMGEREKIESDIVRKIPPVFTLPSQRIKSYEIRQAISSLSHSNQSQLLVWLRNLLNNGTNKESPSQPQPQPLMPEVENSKDRKCETIALCDDLSENQLLYGRIFCPKMLREGIDDNINTEPNNRRLQQSPIPVKIQVVKVRKSIRKPNFSKYSASSDPVTPANSPVKCVDLDMLSNGNETTSIEYPESTCDSLDASRRGCFSPLPKEQRHHSLNVSMASPGGILHLCGDPVSPGIVLRPLVQKPDAASRRRFQEWLDRERANMKTKEKSPTCDDKSITTTNTTTMAATTKVVGLGVGLNVQSPALNTSLFQWKKNCSRNSHFQLKVLKERRNSAFSGVTASEETSSSPCAALISVTDTAPDLQLSELSESEKDVNDDDLMRSVMPSEWSCNYSNSSPCMRENSKKMDDISVAASPMEYHLAQYFNRPKPRQLQLFGSLSATNDETEATKAALKRLLDAEDASNFERYNCNVEEREVAHFLVSQKFAGDDKDDLVVEDCLRNELFGGGGYIGTEIEDDYEKEIEGETSDTCVDELMCFETI